MHTTAALTGLWRRFTRAISLVLVTGLLFSGASSAAASTAHAPPQPISQVLPAPPSTISPATSAQLAAAMGVAPGDLAASDLMGSDVAGVGVSDAPLGTFFPTRGSTFAILSSGRAADASLPNNQGSLSTHLGGLNTNQGDDLVRLHLQLNVPAGVNCANFDFAFYSEEFPEYVGSGYNDAFTAQLNNSSLTVTNTLTGTIPLAPGNFALDTEGNLITVNTVFGVSPNTATTYDGATPLLQARSVVTPSTTIHLYFSVLDVGDSIYDSAVFLDNFRWTQDANCSSGTLKAPRLLLPIVKK
jgi:hypothetical protein